MTTNNPKTPIYSKAVPALNKNCVDCQGNLIPPSFQSAAKVVNLYAGTENVDIIEQRGQTSDDFTISVTPYTDLTLTMSITNPVGVQLEGTSVSIVALRYTVNKLLQAGSFKFYVDSTEISAVPVSTDGYTWDVTLNVSVSSNSIFKVTANDGVKTKSVSQTLYFGSYLYWAEYSKLTTSSSTLEFQALIDAATRIGPLQSRAYGSPYIQPQSVNPSVYFYIAIASSKDDTSIDDMDKFYEHDGQDPGGGMYLLKSNVLISIGQVSIEYNFYIGLHGAQGGALFEIK